MYTIADFDMGNNFDISLAHTLRFEGGFSDDPNDPGGATMYGITIATFRRYTKNPNATADDLKEMSLVIRDDIYRIYYWLSVAAPGLPDGVDFSVFDMGVNAGPGTSIRLLQGVVGTTVDGWIGPKTLKAVKDTNTQSLINWLYMAHEKYYRSLSGFIHFGNGWLARNDARWHAALALLRPPHVAKKVVFDTSTE